MSKYICFTVLLLSIGLINCSEITLKHFRFEATTFRGIFLTVHDDGSVHFEANFELVRTEFDVVPGLADGGGLSFRNESGAYLLNSNNQLRCEYNILDNNVASFTKVKGRGNLFAFSFHLFNAPDLFISYDEFTFQAKIESLPAPDVSTYFVHFDIFQQ